MNTMEPKTLHVLIVDDDPNLLATMRDILRVKGFEPIPVRTAAAARSQARGQAVDVALIDFHLEDMPGLELLRSLKTDSPGIECILLTGHASQSSAIEAINAGAYSYFQKPCDVDQLVLSIQRAGEKRAAERALRASEASLQAVLQSTADGILAIGTENRVLYANGRFAEMWHVPAEILAGQDDAVLLKYVLDQLVDPQGFLQKVQELYQSDEEDSDSLFFKDGRVFERLSRPLVQDGVRIGRVWSFHDVTARKHAEDASRRSDAQYRLLANNISDVIWILDLQTERFTYVSPSAQALRGYTAEEVLAQEMSAALTQASLEHIQNVFPVRLEQAKLGYLGAYLDEVEETRKDGSTVWTETTTHYHLNPENDHWEIYGVSRDISVRRQAQAALQASRAAERNFAERLTVLSETTTELSKTDSLDELCRRTVELGRERLDFDRLAIWFLGEDRVSTQGTFGVDEEGRITDERAERFPIGPDFPSWPVFQGRTPLLRRTDVPLALKGQVVGRGMHVSAGLWDGKDVIGYLVVDNLLRQRPLDDNDCEIIRLYATALGHLISLKRTEQKLRTSEERYRMLAENMTDRIWLMDLNMKTTYISPSVTRQRGFTLDELNTIPLDQQMTPKSFMRHAKMFTTELATERLTQVGLPISIKIELELYKKDGTIFWSENTYSVIRDPQGQPLAILASGHDITENKKAHETLQASEKRFRALIENNTDAIVLVDPHGRVLYESPAYGRMIGRDVRERLGQSSFEYVHPEDRPSVVKLFNELVQKPDGSATATFRNQHIDGSWRWFEATATNLLAESAVQAVVINLHNITDRRQAEENIRQHLAELEVLYETGLSISRLLEPREIGQKVIEALSEKLSWRHASIRLYHPETERMELLVFNRPGLNARQLQAEMRRLNRIITKPGQGLSGWVVQHGQSIRCGNVNADPRFIRAFKGIQSGLYVPMLVGDRTIGVIGVESEQAGAFTEADERLLKPWRPRPVSPLKMPACWQRASARLKNWAHWRMSRLRCALPLLVRK